MSISQGSFVLTPDEKMSKARNRLIILQPFWGMLSLRLILKNDTSLPTMATDGKYLYFNPQFVERLSLEEVMAVVAHEVSHCAYGHMYRRGNREQFPWNAAADKAINCILADAQFKLPGDALMPDKSVWLSNAERLYPDELKKYDKQRQKCAGGKCGHQPNSGHGAPGGFCDGVREPVGADGKTPATASEMDSAQNEWNLATVQAAQAARLAGKLPGGLDRLLDEIASPQVDWKEVLRRFIVQVAKNDYRMFPPNRRFISQGLYLPSQRSEEMGEVVIGVDTSGSVGRDELMAAIAEINGICEDAHPSKVHVVYCDAAVDGVDEFEADSFPLVARDFNPKGGGGTLFQPVFDWVAENDINPACLVYITDMYPSGWPDPVTDYPVMWVATTDVVAPWGETIRINI